MSTHTQSDVTPLCHDADQQLPLRVLLVEDFESDAALVLRELRRGGYNPTWLRTDTAATMAAALAEQSWDIVIADYALPHFSGPAALALLRETGIDLPFIIVSGTIGEDVAVAAMKAGAHDYIMKNHLARLVPAVARELREAAVRRERRRAEQRTAVLLEVAKDISGTLELGELLDRVQRRTAAALPCDYVATFYLDPVREIFRMVSQHGLPAALLPDAEALAFPPEQPFGGQLTRGQTVVINDPSAQPWLPAELYAHFHITALVAAPLRVRGHELGALVACVTANRRGFGAGQVELCEGIARQLAVAMEAVELYRTQQEEAQVSGALSRVGQALIAALNTPTLLDHLCEVTTRVLQCDSSHTLLWQPDEEVYVPIGGYGATPEERQVTQVVKVPRAAMSGLLSLLEHDDVAYIGKMPSDVFSSPDQPQLEASMVLCMALRRGGDIIGVQVARYTTRVEPFASRERRIARGIAQSASRALEHVRLVEELERAGRVKSEFVATVSHELRTPLNIIMGYNSLLLEGDFGSLTAEQTDILQRVDKSSQELLELINTTLDLNRLEAGRLPVERREVSLPDLLGELDAETRALQDKPGLQLVWRAQPGLPRLHTDPVKLKVILKNLIVNALKFTERGSVTVDVHRRDRGVEVTVTDTGIGIAAEALPIVFEPFRQVDSSTTRRHGGVGLGLYIVRRLLDLLGGTVGVDSQIGRGSTFRVWIPASKEVPSSES